MEIYQEFIARTNFAATIHGAQEVAKVGLISTFPRLAAAVPEPFVGGVLAALKRVPKNMARGSLWMVL